MATRRKTSTLTQHSREHVLWREVSRILVWMWPWLGWWATAGAGVALHLFLPGWATGGPLLAIGAGLAALAWHLTRQRHSVVARLIGPLTLAEIAAGLAVAAAVWPWPQILRLWVLAGGGTAMAWSIWLHIHDGADEAGLSATFTRGAEKAGVQGITVLARSVRKVLPGKVEAVLDHPGITHDDVQKQLPAILSGAHLPPGAFTATEHKRDAGRTHLVLSDPAVLDASIAWPGPSRVGASCAEPFRMGLRQDTSVFEFTTTGFHLKICGMTGAGKTKGWGWCEIGEGITRADIAYLGFDITKGRQFLGPAEAALHGLATTRDEAMDLWRGVHRAVKGRTEALADLHLTDWEPGCGLSYLVPWWEEAPDIITLLGMEDDDDALEEWQSDVKAGRTAGMGWRISLQVAHFTEMPTIVREQLCDVCFGTATGGMAKLGLSAYQLEHDCSPELWANREPGKFYIDAKTIERRHATMPHRTYDWGRDAHLFAAHCARFPATARPLDHVTRDLLWPPPAAPPFPVPPVTPIRPPAASREDPEVDNNNDDSLAHVDPDTIHPMAEAEAAAADPAVMPEPAVRMTPEQARAHFRRHLQERRLAGQARFGIADLADIRAATGRSRSWLYDELAAAIADGQARKRGMAEWEWLSGAA